MNEQIRKLLVKAIKEVGPDDDDNGAKEKTLEKFAELIIEECCQKLYDEDVAGIYQTFGLGCKPRKPELTPKCKYADMIPLEQWEESSAFYSDDGSGYWATETHESNWSVFSVDKPEWATHIAWYNK
jgi:hypothetical protein